MELGQKSSEVKDPAGFSSFCDSVQVTVWRMLRNCKLISEGLLGELFFL